MEKTQRLYVSLFIVAFVAVMVLSLYANMPNRHTNPFAGEEVYTIPDSQPCQAARESESADPEAASMLQTICEAPKAVWIGDWIPNVERVVRDVIEEAHERQELPLFVLYNIPNRDAGGGFAEGGAEGGEEYLAWVETVADSIAEAKVVVVVEPDALAGLDALEASEGQERIELIRQAVSILKENPRTYVYIDAGHAFWKPTVTIVDRLKSAGIGLADGFVLNVSNFVTTDTSIAYGKEISRATDGSHFIIDSSRNGLGPTQSLVWCNPPGRALGQIGHVPEADRVDWVGWIKVPGESDGECNGGPEAGEFWPEYALDLVRNAREHNTLN